MWPANKGEALDHTLAAEQAISDLYSTAFLRWIPSIESAVLPTLAAVTASADDEDRSELPPNPDAIQAQSALWDQLTDDLILAGFATIWAVALVATLKALGVELPEAQAPDGPEMPTEVMRAIEAATDYTADEIRDIEARVAAAAGYARLRADMIAAQRPFIADVPMLIRRKVTAVLNDAPTGATNTEIRLSVRQSLNPASMQMRDLARDQGYQAAGVQNDAVLTAASAHEDSDTLEKVWIATLDSRTRPTHFAADGQRTPLGAKFTVGGVQLDHPGDPTGPAREVRNCRCRVGVLAHDEPLPDEVDRHTERLAGRDATAANREGSQQDEINRRAAEGVIRARDDDQDGLGRTASGGITMADDDTSTSEMFRTFTNQPVAMIGTPTSDGRMLATDIDFSVRDCPLPLMWMKQTGSGYGGHTEAFTVGVIESAAMGDGVINASGYMLNTPEADEASSEIGHGVTAPSVDLAALEWMMTDENGKEVSEDEYWDAPMDAQFYMTITKAELIGTTLVATPAFGQTKMELNPDRESRDVALVASAAAEFRPRIYPARMFADPKLAGPTLPTMDDDGRIFGHLACFGECHRSIQSQCVMAPRSRSNYSQFHTSPAVRLDDGTSVPVGRLTVGTGHANDRLNGAAAMAHYDNTGTCFALVRVGEDAHGVWFSGVAAPGATAETIEAGISAPLSGDWRDFGGGLELVAALAVNTPGFTARGRDDSNGRPVTLVASLGPSPRGTSAGAALTVDDIKRAVAEGIAESKRADEVGALLARAERTIGKVPTARERIGELLSGRR